MSASYESKVIMDINGKQTMYKFRFRKCKYLHHFKTAENKNALIKWFW